MKISKIITLITLAVVVTIAGVNVSNLNVYAGSSDVIVNSQSFEKNIDAAVWSVPSEEVVAKDGKIVFPAGCSVEARVITKLAIAKSSQNDELFAADMSFRITNLPKDEQFIVGFSLSSIEAYYGEAENVELIFENKNGLQASLVAYDDSGEQVVLTKAKSCGASVGSNIRVTAQAQVDNKFVLKVNGTTFFDAACEVDLAGRIGFLQTGDCEAEVTAVDIISHIYDTPENTNIMVDFEKPLDKAVMHSRMNGTTGVQATLGIEDYEGSKVLRFRDVGVGYIGTNYQYSNFELTFDVPYILLENILNEEDGSIITAKNSGIAVSCGDASTEYTNLGYGDASEAIIFKGTTVSSQLTGETIDISNMNFFEKGQIGSYSVKITVVDQRMKVAMKSLDATDYTEVLSYSLGNATPCGYVHIWSTGEGNFAIDNIVIKNKDKDANQIEVDYQDSTITGGEDWNYESVKAAYLNQETEKKGFNWLLLIPCAAVIGVAIVGVCLVISQKKSRKKGAPEHEE